MTRTEAIFDIIKGLPELEMADLVNQIHEHCWSHDMGHLFDELYNNAYVDDYIPYGPQWEAEMMKLKKVQMLEVFREIWKKNKL